MAPWVSGVINTRCDGGGPACVNFRIISRVVSKHRDVVAGSINPELANLQFAD